MGFSKSDMSEQNFKPCILSKPCLLRKLVSFCALSRMNRNSNFHHMKATIGKMKDMAPRARGQYLLAYREVSPH